MIVGGWKSLKEHSRALKALWSATYESEIRIFAVCMKIEFSREMWTEVAMLSDFLQSSIAPVSLYAPV